VAIVTGTYALGNRFKIGVTLSTNPNLRRDLEAHYSFDGGTVDWAASSNNVTDVAGGDDNATVQTDVAQYIYATSYDNTVRKIDSNGTEVWSFTGFTDDVYSIAVEPNGDYVYAGSHDIGTTLRKIDSAGNEVWSFTGFTDDVYSIAVVDNGSAIYAVSADSTLRKIDSNGTEVWSFTEFSVPVEGVSVEPDGSHVYAAGGGTVRKIDLTGTEVWSFTGFGADVTSVAVVDDGSVVYAGSEDTTLRKIDSTGSEVWSYSILGGYDVTSVAVEPDGSHVYAGRSDGYITKFDSTGTDIWFAGASDITLGVAVADDGSSVYQTVLSNSWLKKYDSSGNEVWSFTGFTSEVSDVAVTQPTPLSSKDYATSGRLGQGVTLSGLSQAIDAGTIGSNIQTVALWIKPDSDTEEVLQLSSSVDIAISSGSVSTTGFSSPTVYVDGQQTTGGVTAGEWHHIVVTDSSNITADSVKLGEVGGTYYEGAMDDVRFYSRALNETDRQRLFELGATTRINTTISGNEELRNAQVLHYPFDGGTINWALGGKNVADTVGAKNATLSSGDTTHSYHIVELGTLFKVDSTGTEVWSFTGFADEGEGVAVVPDGSAVYGISIDTTLRKIDSTGSEVWSFTGFTSAVSGVAVEDDGSHVYGASYDATLRKIDDQGSEVWSFQGYDDYVGGVAVEDDGSFVYAIGRFDFGQHSLRKIDSSGNEIWSFAVSDQIADVAVDAEGDHIYIAMYDSTLRKIDSAGNEVWSFTGFTGRVLGVAVESDSQYVYAGSYDTTLRKIDSTGTEVWSFTAFPELVNDIAIEADANLYVGSADNTLRKIDTQGNEAWSFSGVASNVEDVSVEQPSGPSPASYAAQGRLGQGLNLSDNSNSVDAGNVGSNIQTVALWVKPDSDTEDVLQLSTSINISLSSGSISTVGFTSPTVYVDGEQAASGIEAGQWHHIVVTDTSNITADAVKIGEVSGSYYNGAIDDFRLFATALSDRLIQRVYELGQSTRVGVTVASAGEAETQLAAHWTFDGASVDWSSNLNNVADRAGHNDASLSSIGFSQHVYIADEYNYTLRKIDKDGNEVWAASVGAEPADVAVEPDGSHAYSVAYQGGVRKIDSSGNEVWSFTGFGSGVNTGIESVAVTDDGNAVYAGSYDQTLRKIDSTGTEVWSFGFGGSVYGIAVEPDGSYVYAVSASGDSTLRKIDSQGSEVWSFTGFTNGVVAVAVEDDGSYVYAGSWDNTLRKIDSTGTEVWSFTGFSDAVWEVAVEQDGSHIYAGSADSTLRKIDSTGTEVWSFTGFTDLVKGAAVSDNGSFVYAGGGGTDDTLRKIDSQGNEVWSFSISNPVDFEGVEGVALEQPDGPASQEYAIQGRLGQALSFTGNDNSVNAGTVGSNIQTVAFWIKPDSDTEEVMQLSSSVDIAISSGSVSTSGFTSPTVYVDGQQTSSGVTAGEWHHIVVTDSSNITADSVKLGEVGGTYYEGVMDDVRLYTGVLSSKEIERLGGN
jgi:streptogramin lyase